MFKEDKTPVGKKVNPAITPQGIIVPFVTGLVLGSFITYIFLCDGANNLLKSGAGVSRPDETVPKNNNASADDAISMFPASEIDYDFYEDLPNKKVVNISEWAAEQDPRQGAETTGDDNAYILQVGSFSQIEAADQVKARLALLGISADIQRVVLDGQDTRYRVRAGPYTEQRTLDNQRRLLQENNLEFMMLKLSADDLRAGEDDGTG